MLFPHSFILLASKFKVIGFNVFLLSLLLFIVMVIQDGLAPYRKINEFRKASDLLKSSFAFGNNPLGV